MNNGKRPWYADVLCLLESERQALLYCFEQIEALYGTGELELEEHQRIKRHVRKIAESSAEMLKNLEEVDQMIEVVRDE